MQAVISGCSGISRTIISYNTIIPHYTINILIDMVIMGLHVYRCISPSRLVCSLMPSGAVGILSVTGLINSPLNDATPENPITVVFRNPMLDEEPIQWSSQEKCFTCTAAALEEAGMIVIPSTPTAT